MALDSKIALAIMEKAKRVFSSEENDTFLSFSLTPMSFTKDQMTSIANGDPPDEALWDFAEYVNSIPSDLIWSPDGRYLWNIYNDLKEVKLASSIRTPIEEGDYQKAFQFLHETRADGSKSDSAAVKVYNAYRDKWILAWQDYNQEKITADNSTDPNVKKQWNDVIKPALSASLDDINKLWTTEGFKGQVEDALRTEEALGSKSPELTWSMWMNLFSPADFKTSPKSYRVCLPTGYTPTNAFDSDSWQTFTLSESEAADLIQNAPIELKSRLAPDDIDLDIEFLTFEYNSVAITRPWLSTDLFKARFWRFYDDSKLLSDGKIPPSGLYPAYVRAIVFVRNLVIKLKPNSSNNKRSLEAIKARGNLKLGFFIAEPLVEKINAQKADSAERAYTPMLRSINSIIDAKAKEKIDASIDKRYDISRQRIKAFLRMDTMKKQDIETTQP